MTAATGPNAELAPTGPAVESVDPDQPFADAAHDSAPLRRSRRRSVVVSLVLVAIAATLTVIMLVDPVDPWVQPFDDWWYRWIAAHRTPWLTRVAEVLAVVGSAWVTVPLRLAIATLLAFRRRWTQLAAFVAAIVVSELCIGPLKAIVGPTPSAAFAGRLDHPVVPVRSRDRGGRHRLRHRGGVPAPGSTPARVDRRRQLPRGIDGLVAHLPGRPLGHRHDRRHLHRRRRRPVVRGGVRIDPGPSSPSTSQRNLIQPVAVSTKFNSRRRAKVPRSEHRPAPRRPFEGIRRWGGMNGLTEPRKSQRRPWLRPLA